MNKPKCITNTLCWLVRRRSFPLEQNTVHLIKWNAVSRKNCKERWIPSIPAVGWLNAHCQSIKGLSSVAFILFFSETVPFPGCIYCNFTVNCALCCLACFGHAVQLIAITCTNARYHLLQRSIFNIRRYINIGTLYLPLM